VAGAQVLPALVGAVLGVVPASILLFALINAINPNDNDATLPPLWQLAVLVAGTVLVVTALTLVPAGFAARRSVAAALRVDDA
jgi:putative ABC transport system permease protein